MCPVSHCRQRLRLNIQRPAAVGSDLSGIGLAAQGHRDGPPLLYARGGAADRQRALRLQRINKVVGRHGVHRNQRSIQRRGIEGETAWNSSSVPCWIGDPRRDSDWTVSNVSQRAGWQRNAPGSVRLQDRIVVLAVHQYDHRLHVLGIVWPAGTANDNRPAGFAAVNGVICRHAIDSQQRRHGIDIQRCGLRILVARRIGNGHRYRMRPLGQHTDLRWRQRQRPVAVGIHRAAYRRTVIHLNGDALAWAAAAGGAGQRSACRRFQGIDGPVAKWRVNGRQRQLLGDDQELLLAGKRYAVNIDRGDGHGCRTVADQRGSAIRYGHGPEAACVNHPLILLPVKGDGNRGAFRYADRRSANGDPIADIRQADGVISLYRINQQRAGGGVNGEINVQRRRGVARAVRDRHRKLLRAVAETAESRSRHRHCPAAVGVNHRAEGLAVNGKGHRCARIGRDGAPGQGKAVCQFGRVKHVVAGNRIDHHVWRCGIQVNAPGKGRCVACRIGHGHGIGDLSVRQGGQRTGRQRHHPATRRGAR